MKIIALALLAFAAHAWGQAPSTTTIYASTANVDVVAPNYSAGITTVAPGTKVKLTAWISGITPDGEMAFKADGAAIPGCERVHTSNGPANNQWALCVLTVGKTQNVNAAFLGDARNLPSESAPLTLTATGTDPPPATPTGLCTYRALISASMGADVKANYQDVMVGVTEAQAGVAAGRFKLVMDTANAAKDKGGPYTLTLGDMVVCDGVVKHSPMVGITGVAMAGWTQVLRKLNAQQALLYTDMDARAKAGKVGPWGN